MKKLLTHAKPILVEPQKYLQSCPTGPLSEKSSLNENKVLMRSFKILLKSLHLLLQTVLPNFSAHLNTDFINVLCFFSSKPFLFRLLSPQKENANILCI